ncbi:MAG: phosphate ABC transporter substrate-binding protein [Caldiserica bacterium]|jgi:phosphate transport system substrate-binding protein|nr:phosphate ABC transporter substrate-binding protein [Caldisericota bacterium]MDH7562607.1 phosphate ABC transporter substrate-binding protein [Caldisericota bacterium]
MKKLVFAFVILGFLATACTSSPSPSPTSPSTGTGLSGNIVVKGSDTMVNLSSAWAEAFQLKNPGVKISVSGGGSGFGITALIDGTADLCNNSRPLKEEEIERARKEKGFELVSTVVALDGVSVVVNPQNPVNDLTLDQLAAIYSGKITNWGEVGGVDGPIVVLARDSNSGTHVFFKEHVVQAKDKNAEYGADVQFLPTSQSIHDEVARNPNAIGFFGLGYISEKVKVLGIRKDASSQPVKPTSETIKDGSYPIARPLFVTSRGEPEGVIKEYLNWILGPEGQRIVAELDFVPLQ